MSLQPETPKRSGLRFLKSHSSHGEPNSRLVLGAAALVALLIGGGVFYLVRKEPGPMPKPPEQPHIVAIRLPPPPPPPPPKKEPEKTEMIKQNTPKMQDQTPKTPSPPKPEAPAPVSVSNNLGPGKLQLGSTSGGSGLGSLSGTGTCVSNCGGGGGGGKYDSYSLDVITKIHDALARNPKTRSASAHGARINIWIDGSGRITRVQLLSSTGNADVDDALRGDALIGLMFKEPPPKDMPMPVLTRITEKKAGT